MIPNDIRFVCIMFNWKIKKSLVSKKLTFIKSCQGRTERERENKRGRTDRERLERRLKWIEEIDC